MDAVIDESAGRAPTPGLRPFVSRYSGYRQAGGAARRHRGLPSPDLTFILTQDDPLVIAVHPDPRRQSASYESLIGGLHTVPALITHDGRRSGIQLAVTPLGARALFGMPARELANWGPKAAARVFRFDGARQRLGHAAMTGAGVRLADLAAEFGYYDQAHLASDFRLLAGCAPTRWLTEEFRFFQAMPDDLGE